MKWLLITSLTLWALLLHEAKSQTITIDTPLDFGRFVIVDNSLQHPIALLPSGGFTADPEYVFFENPQMGTVTVDDFPPATTLNISLGTTTLRQGGSSASFSTLNSFTDPAIVTTDATGSATFDVGAVLNSDGGGIIHSNGLYNSNFTITVLP